MNKQLFLEAYQVIDIKDGEIENNTLVFNEDSKVLINYHHTNKKIDVKYIFEKDVKVELIEFNRLEHFKRSIEVKENSVVNGLFVIDGDNKLLMEENFHLAKNTNLKLSYADFNLLGVNSKNTYFLKGINANLLVNMGIIAKQNGYKDYNIIVENLSSLTTADVINHGLVVDTSKIKIDIIGTINRSCKNSSSKQKSRMMILDNEGKAEVNPKLLIDENEVVASHGASIGQLDKEQLFYLQSRGLSESDAKRLIISGYLLPLVDNFKNEAVSEWFGLLIDKVMN